MGRLILVIADNDEDFTESLVEFISSGYSGKFRINAFTRRDTLEAYFSGEDRVDLLLVNENMGFISSLENKAVLTVLLSETRKESGPSGLRTIFKYQHRECLMAEILESLSLNMPAGNFAPGGKKSAVIAVYSPAGGTGKTTIASRCSVICSKYGLSTFYFGLEALPSVPFQSGVDMGQPSCNRSFSRLIYHMKVKTSNMALVIESCRNVDKSSGVEFFLPPENPLDMEEVRPGEVLELIGHIKALGRYDMVFIDMGSGFDRNTPVLLEECDEVFLVVQRSASCIAKFKAYEAGLEIISNNRGGLIREKSVIILNRFMEGEFSEMGDTDWEGRPCAAVMPEVKGLAGSDHMWNSNASAGIFEREAVALLGKYLPARIGGGS